METDHKEEHSERESNSSSDDTSDSSDSDSKYDITSPRFDPKAALYNLNRVKIPCPDAKIYDNISVFSLTDSGVEIRETNRARRNDEEGKNKKPAALQRVNLKLLGSRKYLSLAQEFERMNEKSVGPRMILKTVMENGVLIKVMTRNDRGFRGFILAYLKAYDRHFNLVLCNVYECWLRPRYPKPVYTGLEEQFESSLKLKVKTECNPKEETIQKIIDVPMKESEKYLNTDSLKCESQSTTKVGIAKKPPGSEQWKNYINYRTCRVQLAFKELNNTTNKEDEKCYSTDVGKIVMNLKTPEFKTTVLKRYRKKEICERYCNFMLLRGSEIVTITPIK